MSSFTRRAAVTTVAFGVLIGALGNTSQAFADETSETIELTSTSATTPAEPPSPSETPAPTNEQPAPPETPPAHAPTPTATATPGSGGVGITLSGFTPDTAVSAQLISADGSSHDATGAFNAPLTADASGGYTGQLNTGSFPAGQYELQLKQANGVTASVTLTIAPSPAPSSPTAPESQPPATPSASPAKPTFLPDEEITYLAEHFTPGEAINAAVTFPDGSSVTAEGDGSGAGQDGSYAGKLSYTGTLPPGRYTVRVFQASGPESTFTFEIAQPQGGAAASPTAPAAGKPAQTRVDDGPLATTGTELPFGAAGLGLLLITGGAAVLVTRRIVARATTR